MRVTLNPTFSIETGELLSHDGQFEVEEFPILFDRSVQKGAQKNVDTANQTAGNFGATAAGIGESLIPGLERQAQNPTGYTPVQKNNMLVSSQEAVGGANSGIQGLANLTAARTRNSGGFAAALDEAARQKGRQLSTNALGVSNADAELAQKKQQMAQQELAGLYGTNTSDQLKAMGLSDEALKTKLAGGQQGWLQQGEGLINTLTGGAKGVADLKNAFG